MLIQEVIADYTMAISIDPQFTLAYTNRGNVRNALGDYQGAIADYTKVIEIKPDNAIAYYNLGLAKGRSGDVEGACTDMKHSAKLGLEDAAGLLRQNCQ